ncbi:MAG TPA: PIN domain-containing protein [Thermococcus paralvinellae]|uniref:PIN domain-containing protein n=1 Tax=Thermococcus paralvinellae TaxID=582419 RepID=A0A832Z9X1_9EURY|nr:PIN domain-containing protein [Thermococcus paralvinellae]
MFVDTNIFYNFLFETELSSRAKEIIEMPYELVTSFTVLNELVYISIRKLTEKRYGTRDYFDFRKFISERGYEPFKEDLKIIFGLLDERGIVILPNSQEVSEWMEVMKKYKLLPNDALIAVTCKHHGIKNIATFDGDFKRIDFLKVIP